MAVEAREFPTFVPVEAVSNVLPHSSIDERGRVEKSVDFLLSKRGAAIAGGAVFGAPFLIGLAQGLNIPEAMVYGATQILTIKSNSPSSEEIKTMLEQWGSVASNQEVSKIIAESVQTYKAILVDAGVIGAVVAFMSRFIQRENNQRQLIEEGKATLAPKGEHVVILGGKGSNIVDEIAKPHSGFVPVFETQNGARNLANGNLGNLRTPYFINLEVPNEGRGISYLKSPGWNHLQLSRENLLHSKAGKRFLLVVGVGPKQDRELSFKEYNVEVSQDDLRSSLLRLKQKFDPSDFVEERDNIDLYVGNGNIVRHEMETGKTISDRELAQSSGVDIYLDTWGVALKAIVDETLASGETRLRLATGKQEYRDVFKDQMPKFLAEYAPDAGVDFRTNSSSNESCVWIVYEGRSEDTFMAARRLKKKRPNAKVLALVSTNLSQHSQSGGLGDVKLIDISYAISEILGDVKYLLKEDYTPTEIQAAIDQHKLPLPRK